MEQQTIQGTIRQKMGKGGAHLLRREGQIPAVFYGKGITNVHFSVNPRELEKAVAGDLGVNTLLKLQLSDGKSHDVMLRDFQADAIKRNFTHADFVLVDLTKKIHVKVPVHLIGKCEGVKDGGILEHITRELDVLCFPNRIPKEIIADITTLKKGQSLHLHDIKLPEGVEPREKVDATIAAVIIPREETPADATANVMTEPEVLTAKKEAAPAEAGKDAGKAKEAPAKDAKAKK